MNRFLTESPWEIDNVREVYHCQLKSKITDNCFLSIDDTISHRPYGKKVEKANYHYDHTINKQSFGYCILTSSLSINETVIPYDIKPYYRKVDCNNDGFVTKNEMTKDIILSTKDMKNIKTVLFDTWFSNKIVIGSCKEAKKNYITQIKSNRNVTINNHKKAVRSFVNSVTNWTYFDYNNDKFKIFSTSAFIKSIGTVHLVFSQMFNNKTKKWGDTVYIISNQINIEGIQLVKDYLRRGGIESFHREAKQNTGLEGYFLRNNRGIERYLFLVMLTYATLVLQGFNNENISIGQMCEQNKIRQYETSFDLIQKKPWKKYEIFSNLAKARV